MMMILGFMMIIGFVLYTTTKNYDEMRHLKTSIEMKLALLDENKKITDAMLINSKQQPTMSRR